MHNHDSLAKKYIYDRTTRHHRTSQFSEQTPTKSLYQASPYTPQKQPNLHIHTRLHNNTPIISAKFITSRADGYMTVRFFLFVLPLYTLILSLDRGIGRSTSDALVAARGTFSRRFSHARACGNSEESESVVSPFRKHS